jgi:hypothetical protein
MVFGIVSTCRFVGGYRRFGGTHCLHSEGNEDVAKLYRECDTDRSLSEPLKGREEVQP